MFAFVAAMAGLAIYLTARQSVTQAAHENLETIALLKAGEVQHWLRRQRDGAELAFGSPLFLGELDIWLKSGMRDERRRSRLLEYMRAVASSEGHFDISIRAPSDGAALLTSAGRSETTAERGEAATAARQMKPIIEDVHAMPGEAGKRSIDFYFPIISGGKALFVADIEADPTVSLLPPLAPWPGASPSSEAMLVKAEAGNVLFLSDLRHGAGAGPPRVPLDAATTVSAQAARGHTGAISGVDYRGVPSLGYALPVAGTSWLIVTKVDQAEAYALLNALALAAAGVGVLMLVAAAAWIVERDRSVRAREDERRRMDEQLRASEERFRQAFEHAPIGMAISDLHGHILAANPANCRLIGFSHAELTAANILDLTHPDDRERDAAAMAALAAGEHGRQPIEKRMFHKDGRILHLSVNRTLVADSGGKPLYFLSQIQDMTERNEAMARIQRLSQLKAAISEVNRAIIRSRAPEDVFRAVCGACVDHGGFRLVWVGVADMAAQRIVPIAMAGQSASYLDGITVSTSAGVAEGLGPTAVAYREGRVQICNDISADPCLAPWRERACSHGLASSIALPLPRGGRSYGALTVYGPEKDFFDDEAVSLLNDMAGNISFAMDQYDRDALRRRYEEDLRRSEEKFRTLVENLPQNVFTMDTDLVFVSCNEPYAKRLGIAAHEIVGKTDYDFYPPALAGKYQRDSRRIMATKEILDVHEECVSCGEPRIVHTIKAPILDEQGEVTGVLGVFWDITANKRAERRLEDLSHRLIAVQEDERRRLAAQLHDRLSPNLAAIKIMLATLRASLPDDARASAGEYIQDAQALVDDTTADIRDICAELRPTLLDYAGLIPALHGYAAQFMKRTAVEVHVATPGDGTRLDPEIESTLFRIAQEALSNCAQHACAKNVFVELSVADPAVTLIIRDDGFGFDAEALERSGGTAGLGLITMKERTEFAGGQFILKAHPLKGTEIRVDISSSGGRAAS